MLLRTSARIALSLLPLALAACGTTERFIDQPPLMIDGPEKDVRRAAAGLFDLTAPYTITLCEADPSSKECQKGNQGITATGVGGLFLPLRLYVTAMTVSNHSHSDDGWTIDANVESKVHGIAPTCQTAHGKIRRRDNNALSLQLTNFYCNWAVVGNVIVNADFSIDNINSKDKFFTGFYKVTFYGTGNASGSGYFRAALLPKT
jgi:hypothetical protein